MRLVFGLKVHNMATKFKIPCAINLKHLSKSSGNPSNIIDCKAISFEIRADLRKQVDDFIASENRPPKLVSVTIGDNPGSKLYIRGKMSAAKDVGIESVAKSLPAAIKQNELLNFINILNKDNSVDGILVTSPMPKNFNFRTVCNAISHEKDVDGLNERNIGRLCIESQTIIPCTPLGIRELITRMKIETIGKNAVVIGRSAHVGLPMSILLSGHGTGMGATVTICHVQTPFEELKRYCKAADIIVVAVGKPGLISADMVKEGACVIDVGLNKVKNDDGTFKIVGDVDFDEVSKIAGLITPVSGVGSMTVAMLMNNTVKVAKSRAKKKSLKCEQSEDKDKMLKKPNELT